MKTAIVVRAEARRLGGVRLRFDDETVFETMDGLERIGLHEAYALERLAAAILRAAGRPAVAASAPGTTYNFPEIPD